MYAEQSSAPSSSTLTFGKFCKSAVIVSEMSLCILDLSNEVVIIASVFASCSGDWSAEYANVFPVFKGSVLYPGHFSYFFEGIAPLARVQ